MGSEIIGKSGYKPNFCWRDEKILCPFPKEAFRGYNPCWGCKRHPVGGKKVKP